VRKIINKNTPTIMLQQAKIHKFDTGTIGRNDNESIHKYFSSKWFETISNAFARNMNNVFDLMTANRLDTTIASPKVNDAGKKCTHA
jgi:hypothetical protein